MGDTGDTGGRGGMAAGRGALYRVRRPSSAPRRLPKLSTGPDRLVPIDWSRSIGAARLDRSVGHRCHACFEAPSWDHRICCWNCAEIAAAIAAAIAGRVRAAIIRRANGLGGHIALGCSARWGVGGAGLLIRNHQRWPPDKKPASGRMESPRCSERSVCAAPFRL